MCVEFAEKQDASDSCRLYVGTSGYAYREWTDAGFYPAGIKSVEMLSFYAQRFSAVELNYTWYQMPKAETVERRRRKVPPEFLFAAKVNRTLTHEIDPASWREKAAAYREGVAPLVQAGQLGALLVQLPPSFTRTQPNRGHLAALLDALDGLPLAVEFRHRSWVHDRVFVELERRRVTLVSVDEPDLPGLFPALDAVTCPSLFYARFHGRNAEGWRSGSMQNQFDYTYSEDQLREWVQERIIPMAGRAEKGIIFFNNHVRAQAVENASQMIRILAEEGLGVR
jgi:uncharacterized protein YecE (DUF72 family)